MTVIRPKGAVKKKSGGRFDRPRGFGEPGPGGSFGRPGPDQVGGDSIEPWQIPGSGAVPGTPPGAGGTRMPVKPGMLWTGPKGEARQDGRFSGGPRPPQGGYFPPGFMNNPGRGVRRGNRFIGPHVGPPVQQDPTFQDQFNAFLQQDPSALGIASTQSLADLYGDSDFSRGGMAYDSGSTMQKTIRNKFLESLDVQDRGRVANHMGYFTGGERVNAPQGGFQWTGSLPELQNGQTWMAQNNGVNYGSYSRGDDGNYSWDPIGDRAGAYGVQPGTTDPMRTKTPYGGGFIRRGRMRRRAR